MSFSNKEAEVYYSSSNTMLGVNPASPLYLYLWLFFYNFFTLYYMVFVIR